MLQQGGLLVLAEGRVFDLHGLPPLSNGLHSPGGGGVELRVEHHVGRDVDLERAVMVQADVVDARRVVDAGLLEVGDDCGEDGPQIEGEERVEEGGLGLRVLPNPAQTVLDHLVVEGVVGLCACRGLRLSRAAPHYFAQSHDVRMSQLDHLLQALRA